MFDVYSSKRAVSAHGLDPSPYVGPTPPSSRKISVTQVSYSELNIDNIMVAEQQLFKQRSEGTLKNHRKDTLQAMSLARRLSVVGSKQDLVKALLKWVCFGFKCLSIIINNCLACRKPIGNYHRLERLPCHG